MNIQEELQHGIRKKCWLDSPTKRALQQAYTQSTSLSMSALFEEDLHRVSHFQSEACNLHIDFSKHLITRATWRLLLAVAEESHVRAHIDALFSGALLNVTEQRPALHTALRQPYDQPCWVDGENILPFIQAQFEKMAQCVHEIHQKSNYTDIVHLGIGGSELGPRFVSEALVHHAQHKVRIHYVSALDPAALQPVLAQLSPHHTAFIIASKSFRTQETLENAHAARAWLAQKLPADRIFSHFYAITAAPALAQAWGVPPAAILEIAPWVGGRFSIWSPIGFPVALSIGMEAFHRFRAGGYAFDRHMITTPLSHNLALILALLSLWYVNYAHLHAHGILPYSYDLRGLPAYIQQIEMESNGKSVSLEGQPLDYHTSPIIWGCMGTNGQHAFHQWLHQGTSRGPIDIIVSANTGYPTSEQHTHLLSHALAQAHALMMGHNSHDPHTHLPGNRPSTCILLRDLSPFTVGALCALYEHKAFLQSVLWRINAFDQYGVEFGKTAERTVFPCLKTGGSMAHLDASTQSLIRKIRTWQAQG